MMLSKRDRKALNWVAGFTMLMAALFIVLFIATGIAFGQPPRQLGPLNVAPTSRTIELGRQLFFDKRISTTGTVSCATCHDPKLGWSDGKPVAVGINNLIGTRNSPTLLNVGYVKPLTFWDGRAIETADQALLPMSNPIEMGQQTTEQVLVRLENIPEYKSKFALAFNPQTYSRTTRSAITGSNLAKAIADFESTITTFHAPIDAFLAGDQRALSSEAKIGYELFKKANCMQCHPAPLYTDNQLHNVGAEFATRGRIIDRGAAGVARNNQLGRNKTQAEITADEGKFKTPTLRGISRSGPYMHNGRFTTLKQCVRHFNMGGFVSFVNAPQSLQRDRVIDQRIIKQGWTDDQENYVVKFLLEAFEGYDYPMIEGN